MSPADAGPLLVLAGRIERQIEALARLAQDVLAASAELERAPGGPWRAALALALDRLYTAIEDTLAHVAREIDRTVPAGPAWHRDLLQQALLGIPGLRPAVLDPSRAADAERLLAFRHFLRHAYLVELDAKELEARAADAERLAAGAAEDLARFVAFLRGAVTM